MKSAPRAEVAVSEAKQAGGQSAEEEAKVARIMAYLETVDSRPRCMACGELAVGWQGRVAVCERHG